MKPQILGQINPQLEVQGYKESFFTEILDRRSNWFGDVDPIGTSPREGFLKKLVDFGEEHGLRYRKQAYYTGPCYLPLRGSVGWHTDEGIGHLLNWVLYREDYSESVNSLEPPCLLCQSAGKMIQLERLKVGDVFIFNGNYGHAWISNESCVLAQVTVSVKRGHTRAGVI